VGPVAGIPTRYLALVWRPLLDGAKPQAALVVEHLTKRFGERVAYEDVSFEVGYGEVFGFLGPNREERSRQDRRAEDRAWTVPWMSMNRIDQ
jgi:hypothetical protein